MLGEAHSTHNAVGARIKPKMCCFIRKHDAVCVKICSSSFNWHANTWFAKTRDLISVISFLELCLASKEKPYFNFYYLWKEFYCLKDIKIETSNQLTKLHIQTVSQVHFPDVTFRFPWHSYSKCYSHFAYNRDNFVHLCVKCIYLLLLEDSLK